MPIRRLLPNALAVLAAGLLTACSTDSQTDSVATTASTAATSAAQAAAPVIEPGEFDPEGDFKVIDPCTEIPAEVLEAAGVGEQVGEPYYEGGSSVLCSFTSPDRGSRGLITLTGDRNPRDKLSARGLIFGEDVSQVVDGMYLHDMPGGLENDCNAAVHTRNGRLIASYSEISAPQDRKLFCGIAISTLESIVTSLGENNGNSY